jgi:hypothetical protein
MSGSHAVEAIDVPDMDVLRLGFGGSWRKPARLTKSGAVPSTVAHHLSDALAQTVRQKGGCPGLNDLLDAAGTRQGLWDQPDSRLQAAELSENDHVRMAADVLRSRLAAGKPVDADPAAKERAGQEIVTRFLDHYFFGRLPKWVGKEPFADLSDLQRFRADCDEADGQSPCHPRVGSTVEPALEGPFPVSRGLVFLTVGYCTAVGADCDELQVYENGIGALNLSLTPAQIGTHNTRSVHPRTLDLASALFSLVGERSFEVKNPSLYSTKGQLVAAMADQFRDLILDTFSCDTAYASRIGSVRCGRCTSCLLRRQSLWAAGLRNVDLSESYKHDGFGDGLDEAAIETLSVMLFQVMSFEHCLNAADPWEALLLAFPALAALPVRSRSDKTLSQGIVKLLAEYVDEWREMPVPVVQSFLEEPHKTPEWRHDRPV